MTILLTGFEPFAGSRVNPSEQAARALDGAIIAGQEIRCAILPVDGQRAPQALMDALAQHSPKAVLCLGEAAGRACVSIERVAVNLLDYRIADNAGQQVVDQAVIAGCPAAYFVTLPTRRMYERLLAEGIPCELSLSAGAFLCNQVLYALLHFAEQDGRNSPLGGFIHLPSLPQQTAERLLTGKAAQANMGLETSLRAVRAALEVIAEE